MEFPIAFCDVANGYEEKCHNSYVNRAEVDKVQSLVRSLLDAGDLQGKDIGVISPYLAQVSDIKQRLNVRVEVASADAFQGKEKEVIIVSTTRANESGELGFVQDLRRMNVALTRAKRGIIVVGHETTLKSDKEGWRRWSFWRESL